MDGSSANLMLRILQGSSSSVRNCCQARTCMDRGGIGGLGCEPTSGLSNPTKVERMTRALLDERANRAGVRSGRLLACCFVALTVLTLAGVSAADRSEVIIERDVQTKMRDGIILRADVCRPKTDGKFPVLLTRTPYDKGANTDICLKA